MPNETPTETVAVLVLIETDDPRLLPGSVKMDTAEDVARLRAAAIKNLPKLTRVVAVMSEDSARLMCMGHEYASRVAGMGGFTRTPPADYRAPGDPNPPFIPGGRKP